MNGRERKPSSQLVSSNIPDLRVRYGFFPQWQALGAKGRIYINFVTIMNRLFIKFVIMSSLSL